MHHFGEDSTEVKQYPDHYKAIFTNKSTGTKITMRIPVEGVFDAPGRDLTMPEAEHLAREVAHILRAQLV